MSWLYSQALVAEFLAGNCSDGERFAQLKSTPTPRAYLSPDRMTAFSRPSRFGMTFAPLTDDRGAELLTWYLEDFLAKTSAQRGAAPESTGIAADYGRNSRGSLAKYDPVSRSWKTRQYSLLGGLTEFSETWPRWGMTRDGELYQLRTLVRRTSERESGLWPTPLATDGSKGGPNQRGSKGDVRLASAVHRWPTPQASDNRDRGNLSSGAVKKRMAAGKQTMLSQVVSEKSGQLNPTWVEWLMGFPLGWTDLKPLETDKYHNVQP